MTDSVTGRCIEDTLYCVLCTVYVAYFDTDVVSVRTNNIRVYPSDDARTCLQRIILSNECYTVV